MTAAARIYLDNAATSWPKPPAVYAAVDHFLRELGAPSGRSAYHEASEVERLVAQARRQAARLVGATSSQHVIFTSSGTDSLNLALHGLLRAGDHVVTTVVEHNSVLRPLRSLESQGVIEVTRVQCDAAGLVDPDAIGNAIRPATRLIALIHVSNVTGAIQPVEQVGQIARQHGLAYLVDAAQSLGHVPLRISDLGAQLVAAPAHKGLLAPLGLGLLFIEPGFEEQLATLRQGGTGTRSNEDWQPGSLPDKYEVGNLNVPAIAGLQAALEYMQPRGVEAVRRQLQQLTGKLLAGLQSVPGVTIYGPRDAARQAGVVSITAKGYDPQELAATLDAAASIQTRPGIQCAPLMHRSLGTLSTGGTVRFSLGVFTTEEQIDRTIRAVAEIVGTTS